MPPTPAAIPRKRLLFPEDENDGAPTEAGGNSTAPAGELLDAATASAVQETRQAFFGVRDAGASNRIEQGQLLRKAQAQLAKYGSGTFTAMLLAPRPAGFAFRSTTSAYDLMAEAEGQPKRSHKATRNTGVSTPGRLNQPPLPLNLEGAAAPTEEAKIHNSLPHTLDTSDQSKRPTPGRSNAEAEFMLINLEGVSCPADPGGTPDDLPATLDTSHTPTYVSLGFKGVYIPKTDVEGFTTWLQSFSNAVLSDQFLAWYRAANCNPQKEQSNETNSSIQ